MSVYLDYAATTPVDYRFVEDATWYMLNKYYNPSSAYSLAADVKRDIEDARMQVAMSINAEPEEIIFTSGATEANNMVLEGTSYNLHISPYEHPSVKNKKYVHKHLIDINDFKPLPEFYSFMLANNETGAIFPIKELCSKVYEVGGVFHTDATQAYGHIPIDVKDLGVDFLTVSFHKCGCAKGIGFLYKRNGIELDPLMYGGGQEHGLRPGTENTAYIYATGKHVERLFKHDIIPNYNYRDRLKNFLRDIKGISFNETENQLPNILSITVDGIRSDQLVAALDEWEIMISAGSACHAGDPSPSKTLLAFGLSEEQALSTVRVSWGNETSWDDLEFFIKQFRYCVNVLREEIYEETHW